MLRDDLNFFIANQDKLVERYGGRTLVIKDGQVVGDYDDALSAYLAAKASFPPGSFSIQRCEPGSDAYTVVISTLGLFAAG